MTLNEVLKNTNYDVSLFSEEARKFIEEAIVVNTVRGKETPFITCLKRGKEIVLKPEEAVRQLYLYKLIHEYGYPTAALKSNSRFILVAKSNALILPSWTRIVRLCPISLWSSRNLSSAMVKSSSNLTAMPQERPLVYGRMASKFPITIEKTRTISSRSQIFQKFPKSSAISSTRNLLMKI